MKWLFLTLSPLVLALLAAIRAEAKFYRRRMVMARILNNRRRRG